MYKYIIFYVFIGVFTSCKESPIIDPPIEEEMEVFEMVWFESIEDDFAVGSLADGQVYRNLFLVPGHITEPFTLYGFNTITGEKEWTYMNQGVVMDEILESKLFENLYLATTNTGIVAIDLDKLERVWEVSFQSFDYESDKGYFIHNGFLYDNFSVGGVGLFKDAVAMLKIDLRDGSFEEIYRQENDSIGIKSLSPCIVYTNNDGHEIMIFNERPDAENPPQECIQEIVAWDITAKKELWRNSHFTEFYSSNFLHIPVIYQNSVITGGDWSIYAFDINTGEQIWRYQVPGYDKFGIWNRTNHLLKDGRLYVNPGGPPICCLNPSDGSVIWENLTDASNCSDNIHYYEKEDYLVYTSWGKASIYVLDALTGELIHKESQFENSEYNNDPVYDEETDMFFTTNYKYAIGFKVHKPN